jgi:hypothetical protein
MADQGGDAGVRVVMKMAIGLLALALCGCGDRARLMETCHSTSGSEVWWIVQKGDGKVYLRPYEAGKGDILLTKDAAQADVCPS